MAKLEPEDLEDLEVEEEEIFPESEVEEESEDSY